jgi:hypothetical protein
LDWAVTRRRDGSPFSKWSKFVDKDLIGVRFSYVDGRILEVTAVDPKIPWTIQYRDLTTGAEGVMLSIYVRRAKQREHLENLKRPPRSLETRLLMKGPGEW